MNKGIAWTVLSCLAFMAIILSLFISRMNTTRELTEQEYKDLGAYFIDPPRQLSDFHLISDQNIDFVIDDFKGQWNILFFGFTFCPDICPLTMKQLSDVKEELMDKADRINFYLVSIDPDRDSPENLRTYLDNFDKEFIGLTGEIDKIYKFSTQVNAPFFPVINSNEENYTVDHSGSLVIINPEGNYAGFFRAPHDQNKIIKALDSLLN
ncbi:MAG TPA: SCO family protein [SAR86 cluster bacterium]|nr:SCO family protein [SAR86 cluster bacterium]|tara:strand:- start:313 stop:939 length:627 start_codon:yes stop_codon:yes gene_type:complete